MPSLKQPPDSNVPSEPPTSLSHWYHPRLNTPHLYLALGAAAALVVLLRFAKARKCRRQRHTATASSQLDSEKAEFDQQDRQPYYRKDSPVSYDAGPFSAVPSPNAAAETPGVETLDRPGHRGWPSWSGGGPGLPEQQIWATGLLGPAALAGNWGSGGPPSAAQAMDSRGSQRRDTAASGPPEPASRGVSISPSAADHPLRHQQNPSSGTEASGYHSKRGGSTSRRHSGSSDGAYDSRPTMAKGKGKDQHADEAAWPELDGGDAGDHMASRHSEDPGLSPELGFVAVDYTAPGRLPPPPPMTPLALHTGSFKFEDRRPGYAVSIPPQLDTTFIHRPNPDYQGNSTSADVMSSSPVSATSSPGARRRSYNKSIPISIPNAPSSSQDHSLAMAPADSFLPASYPPTSPLLPPPPPGHEFGYDPVEYAFDDPNAPPVVGAHGEIDLQGEIISVMDGSGRGWKRHTRVYGGGVCLACVASGGEHGGFYGDNVPPEQRR